MMRALLNQQDLIVKEKLNHGFVVKDVRDAQFYKRPGCSLHADQDNAELLLRNDGNPITFEQLVRPKPVFSKNRVLSQTVQSDRAVGRKTNFQSGNRSGVFLNQKKGPGLALEHIKVKGLVPHLISDCSSVIRWISLHNERVLKFDRKNDYPEVESIQNLLDCESSD